MSPESERREECEHESEHLSLRTKKPKRRCHVREPENHEDEYEGVESTRRARVTCVTNAARVTGGPKLESKRSARNTRVRECREKEHGCTDVGCCSLSGLLGVLRDSRRALADVVEVTRCETTVWRADGLLDLSTVFSTHERRVGGSLRRRLLWLA